MTTFDISNIGLSFDEIRIISDLLRHTNHVYVVGGAVRDLLLGHTPKDFDIATDLKPDRVIGIFGNVNSKLTGNSFPTVRVKRNDVEIEVSTFRKEISTGEVGNRNAFTVEYSHCIEDDLARRDLVINALAIHAKTGKLIDLFGGASDIHNRIIRFVNDPIERIAEDPLRLLRAIRFRLKIDGKYDIRTIDALKSERAKTLFVKNVSSERIREEILKGVATSNKFSKFFDDLKEFGLLETIFPVVHKMIGHDGGPHHGEDVFTHSMLAGDGYTITDPDDPKDVLAKFAAYLHDYGKPASYDPELRNFLGHHKTGADLVRDDLKKFRFSVEEIDFISRMVYFHMKRPTTLKGIRRLFFELGDDVDYVLKIFLADIFANTKEDALCRAAALVKYDFITRNLPDIRDHKDDFLKIVVNGHDVMTTFGLKPGKHIGEILAFAHDLVLDDPVNNDKTFLLGAIRDHFGF